MKKILIIDDEEKILEMLSAMLGKEGYDVIVALDGDEGLRLYRETGADLVITDIVMPEKQGLEIIHVLKKEFPGVKIIAMSGGSYIEPEPYLDLAEDLGVEYTFAKPFDTVEFLDAVRTVLDET